MQKHSAKIPIEMKIGPLPDDLVMALAGAYDLLLMVMDSERFKEALGDKDEDLYIQFYMQARILGNVMANHGMYVPPTYASHFADIENEEERALAFKQLDPQNIIAITNELCKVLSPKKK